MSINSIIFDFGGVLVDFNPERSLSSHFPPELHETINNATYLSPEWTQMDKGILEVEDAVEIMCSRLPEELRAETAKMILDREREMPPIDAMYPVVEALHNKKYKIYLLSNCPMWLFEYQTKIPAMKFFDGLIVSAEFNQVKPEKDIYFTLFNRFNLNASECFFIDDSERNIETGRQLGMKAHCFSDKNIKRLKFALSKEGVEI